MYPVTPVNPAGPLIQPIIDRAAYAVLLADLGVRIVGQLHEAAQQLPGISDLPGIDALPGAADLPGIDALPGAADLPGIDALPGAAEIPRPGGLQEFSWKDIFKEW